MEPHFTLVNALSPLNTPTYDGSGQAFHPDILKFLYPKLPSSYFYYMAMTPYPNGNDDYENPSILLSKEKESQTQNWTPNEVANPVVSPPQDLVSYHNCDVDVVFANDTFYLFWLLIKTTREGLIFPRLRYRVWLNMKKSTDGIHYGETIECLNEKMFCPSFLYENGKFKVIYSKMDLNLYYREGSTPQSLGSEHRLNISQTYRGQEYILWHPNVNRLSNRRYWMLCASFSRRENMTRCILFFHDSNDLKNWNSYDRPVLMTGSWDSVRIHRSDFIVEDGKIKVWYGAQGLRCGIGYAEANVNLDPSVTSSNIIQPL